MISMKQCRTRLLFEWAGLCGRLTFTAALCFAFWLALGCRLALGLALDLTGGLAFGGRIAGGRFVGLDGRIIAAYCCTVGFTTVGNIPARAFEDNAHWLKNAPHGAGARRTCLQRFVFKGLEPLKLGSAAVARIDIGRHSRHIL